MIPSIERYYDACRKCLNTITEYHCISNTCCWCKRCGDLVRNEAYERIIHGQWSSGEGTR